MNPVTPVSQATEARVQKQIENKPEIREAMRKLALRRALSALAFSTALFLFLLWLPWSSRRLLILSLVDNSLLIVMLLVFALVAMSLLWARGQTFDVWLFKFLNLRGYHAKWMDVLMWVATQIGNVGFAVIVLIATYWLGYRRFALGFALGSITLLLLVTIIKAFADRARPFKLLLETRVVGWKEAGLSFPSGHTAQASMMMTIAINYFHFPLPVSIALYAVVVLVGFTRVYLGVHYPRDVMAGAVLGVIWGNVGALVAPYLWS